jgi:hypothetical protein
MSNAEVVAYLLGADRAGLPGGIVGFIEMPWSRLQNIMSDDEQASLRKLGPAAWAYWVRRGWDEARAIHDALP